ncbi:MAG: hypothetical protein NZM12_10910, partial [Steroidobacteraceae bacterium]|nr:hypothetical protein [Steroidobacteraceae bacterium]MDW8260763.1 hypothetical protein [Gammaproteobacteria bacterium]
GGYALPGQEGENLPEDVQLATLDILRRLHADEAVRPDVVSESLDGYSYTLRRPEGALSPAAQDMLRPYRVLML